jgi:hypothetical protein
VWIYFGDPFGVPAMGQNEIPPSDQAQGARESSLQLQQVVVCQKVTDRNPVLAGEVFSSRVGALYCFTRVEGAAGETEITHNWYYQGALKASVQLPVRAANWRTWSKKSILPELTGEWMVEVLGENGAPMESVIFYVQ